MERDGNGRRLEEVRVLGEALEGQHTRRHASRSRCVQPAGPRPPELLAFGVPSLSQLLQSPAACLAESCPPARLL